MGSRRLLDSCRAVERSLAAFNGGAMIIALPIVDASSGSLLGSLG